MIQATDKPLGGPSQGGPSHLMPLTDILPPTAYAMWRADLSASSSGIPAIDIRVEWEGQKEGDLGRFEVKLAGQDWASCRNLAVDMPVNDLIVPSKAIPGDKLCLRFHRGPSHGDREFQVRALAITWEPGKEPRGRMNPEDEFVRGIDYRYVADTDFTAWQASTPGHDGVQALEIELSKGGNYEVWVRLLHPSSDSEWSVIDPLVDPDPEEGPEVAGADSVDPVAPAGPAGYEQLAGSSSLAAGLAT